MRRVCCCILFVVCHQFSRDRQFFFDEKILCVHRRDHYPNANPAYSVWQKTCLRNMTNAFYTLFAVRRFFVVSPLFHCCSRIVYSRLFSRPTRSCCIVNAHTSWANFLCYCSTVYRLTTILASYTRHNLRCISTSRVCSSVKNFITWLLIFKQHWFIITSSLLQNFILKKVKEPQFFKNLFFSRELCLSLRLKGHSFSTTAFHTCMSATIFYWQI